MRRCLVVPTTCMLQTRHVQLTAAAWHKPAQRGCCGVPRPLSAPGRPNKPLKHSKACKGRFVHALLCFSPLCCPNVCHAACRGTSHSQLERTNALRPCSRTCTQTPPAPSEMCAHHAGRQPCNCQCLPLAKGSPAQPPEPDQPAACPHAARGGQAGSPQAAAHLLALLGGWGWQPAHPCAACQGPAFQVGCSGCLWCKAGESRPCPCCWCKAI